MKKGTVHIHSKLRDEIQKKLGVMSVTSRFFNICSKRIYEEMHIRVSTSTLKRYWHYVDCAPDYQPNRYTLDTLVQFVGYTCWDTFCDGEQKETSEISTRHMAKEKLKQLQEQVLQMQKELVEICELLSEKE